MAELFVRHTLNPRKAVKFNLTLSNYALKDEESTPTWLLEIGTTELDYLGKKIAPKYIHKITEPNIEKEIEKSISQICSLIDWSNFDEDRYPPIIASYAPEGSNVRIKDPVRFVIRDKSPSSGIDLSDMKVILDVDDFSFDITSEVEIKGDPYEYTVSWWSPKL